MTVAQLPTNLRVPSQFTEFAMQLARHKGDYMRVAEEVQGNPVLDRVCKAAISSGTTSDSGWASETVDFRRMSGEFVSRLRPATIIGKLRGIRYIPSATRTIVESAGGGGGWVPENAPTPLSDYSLDEVLIDGAKLQAGLVLSDESVRTMSAASLAWLEQLMVRTLAAVQDVQFIDSTVTAGDGPASITSGANATSSTGVSAAQVLADLKGKVEQLISAGSDLSNVSWVMHPRTALGISVLTNTSGEFVFPNITPLGGSVFGLPVITSSAVQIDTGNDTEIYLVDASRILVADDGLAAVDVSRQASLQMKTDPSSGAQSLVSLWATNLVALRLTRWISWRVVDSSAIAVLTDVAL